MLPATLREVGIASLPSEKGLRERSFGDSLVKISLKLCSHTFSEKRSVLESIAEGSAHGMADCFLEGWGQRLEPRDGKPSLAVNDCNAEFHLTIRPIHAPEPQRAGQGHSHIPRGEDEPLPQFLFRERGRERERAPQNKKKCPNCPACNWTTRSVRRSCGPKLPPGNSVSTSVVPGMSFWATFAYVFGASWCGVSETLVFPEPAPISIAALLALGSSARPACFFGAFCCYFGCVHPWLPCRLGC